jgi:hypothetical protein
MIRVRGLIAILLFEFFASKAVQSELPGHLSLNGRLWIRGAAAGVVTLSPQKTRREQ